MRLHTGGPVDLWATERQYLAHLAPIWLALPPEARGVVYCSHQVLEAAAAEGLGPLVATGQVPYAPERLCLVASYQDHRSSRRTTVYVEHGAGQSYDGYPACAGHPSYSGGPDHQQTALFVCPSRQVAARWRAVYPEVPTAVVGCPKLYAWHTRPCVARGTQPTVAFSWHADIALCPETRSGWPHYGHAMPAVVAELAAQGVRVLGHSHPRLWSRLAPRWVEFGAEPVEDFAQVLAQADLYAADNSSTLPEFASTGRPVLWLNAPWYRRDVQHGGRFWRWPQGQQVCDGPDGLVAAVWAALADPPEVAAARARMVAEVYERCDGHAAERAAAAILRLPALGG